MFSAYPNSPSLFVGVAKPLNYVKKYLRLHNMFQSEYENLSRYKVTVREGYLWDTLYILFKSRILLSYEQINCKTRVRTL